MALINVKNITFCYDGSSVPVFENASFSIDTAWKTGLVGRNGRGKTTLLRLLTGELSASGTTDVPVRLVCFPFDVPDRDMTGSEIFAQVCPGAQEWQLLRELAAIGTDGGVLYRPYSTLSGGEQTRLLLCMLFLHDGAFPLIDEPTNCLDAAARDAVAEYLSRKSGFILVSHDRDLLERCTDHTLSINRADIELVKGGYAVWQENFERRQAFEEMQDKKLRGEISRLREAARRSREWADTSERRKIGFDPVKVEKSLTRRPYEAAKSKAMMKRALSTERRRLAAAEEKESLLKNREKSESLRLPAAIKRSGALLTAQGVVPYRGGRALCAPVSFTLYSGDRLCLSGRNGCGKSTLLSIFAGARDIEFDGSISRAAGITVSLAEQDASALYGSLDEIAQARGGDPDLMRAILARLGFTHDELRASAQELSEGQKKKALIACSLSQRADLYIWDEPLNFVDIISRIQLERLLGEFSPTMLLAEHDRRFCRNTSTTRLWLNEP